MRLPGRAGSRFALLIAAALVLASCGGSAEQPAPSRSGLESIGAGLRGPAGMKASVYASGLRNVSALALDDQGRLWVTTSAAANHSHDGVYLISGAGARPVKAISGLKGPLGLTWSGDELFVASMGRVDAFGGVRGNRFTERRLVLKEPSGHGWNDNLVKAPDGRLVMSISADCDHCTPRSPWSGSIVSFKPDGSDVRFYARRLRAGYGMAYVPGTTDLLVSMNQRNDLGSRTTGDALGLVREGDDWGFPACYGQGGNACKGVPKAVAVLDKHAAAGGLTVSDGSALVSEWMLGKVLRVQLTKTGSGYTGTVTTWLTGLKNPLAVATSTDGSVLVGDWGSGTIYRIARG
jgi:glucose/arabinose dehydrogenase